jgi:hypothetical protein
VGFRLGEFEITRMLGEGGFGIVYLANDHSLQRMVALKEYMPSSLAMRLTSSQVQVKSERHRETFDAGLKSFINEARLLAQFDHPALVKVHRFWEGQGTAYMVMPFYEGTTLKQTLQSQFHRQKLAPDETWLRELLSPLCEALSVIHAEHCYHRDIAPDNVMLLGGMQTRPLLLDFGAARRVIGDMTQALTAILKPGYAPVEQYAEVPGMKQGPWTDIYALAAVIYAAITGRTPPPSVGRLLNDDYRPLTELAEGRYSHDFLAAVDRALIVRPEQRTQDVATLRAELGLGESRIDIYTTRPLPLDIDRVAANAAPSPSALVSAPTPRPATRAAAPAPRAAAPRSLRPLWLGAGVGAVLLGAVAVGVAIWPRPAPPPATSSVATPATTPATTPAPAAPVQAAAPAAPAPAAAPTVLDINRAMDEVVQGQAAGFDVGVRPDRTPLRIGRDSLTFTVTSARNGYLYVLLYGSDDSLIQLYPNTGSGALQVRAGEAMRLPKPPVVFEATGPAGPNRLLVLVSPRQRDFSAMDPRADGAYRLFPTGAETATLTAAYTGKEPILAGRAICPSGQACSGEYGAAVAVVDVVP